jgi:hypothetical protein
MNEQNQIEVITGSATKIITSLQSAIFSAMEASSEGVQSQVKMAAAFQKMEMQEQILDWLVQRRIDQEKKLEQADLRPTQRLMIQHKIAQIDGELQALLRSSGIDDAVASKAVQHVIDRPRIPRGEPGAGRFQSTSDYEKA